jgi:hypothetical protein
MNWIEAAGYLASALVLATFCMKTMIPLRCAAVCSNVAFSVLLSETDDQSPAGQCFAGVGRYGGRAADVFVGFSLPANVQATSSVGMFLIFSPSSCSA